MGRFCNQLIGYPTSKNYHQLWLAQITFAKKRLSGPLETPISEPARKRCWIEISAKEIPEYLPGVVVLLTLFGKDALWSVYCFVNVWSLAPLNLKIIFDLPGKAHDTSHALKPVFSERKMTKICEIANSKFFTLQDSWKSLTLV